MDELPVAIPIIIHNNDNDNNHNNEYEIVRIVSRNETNIMNNSLYHKLRRLTHIVCFIICIIAFFCILITIFTNY